MSTKMYQEMFLEEAKDLFESASNILLEVEQTGELEKEQMNQLFRDIHTLKGSGSSVELKLFSKFTHDMETLMDMLRNNKIEFKSEMTEDLIDSLDLMENLLDMEVNGELTDENFDEYTSEQLKKIRKFSNQNDNDLNIKEEKNKEKTENFDNYGFLKNNIKSTGYKKIEIVKKVNEKKEVVKEKIQIDRNKTSENIRVDLSKIDNLMNNVGELVITNAMLKQYIQTLESPKIIQSLDERVSLLERHIREMQNSIMNIRMIPMSSIYQKFPKMIRDTSKQLNKTINFEHFGDNVEIDKTMIEGLTDPLMHIIRNSIDHGIEPAEERGNKNPNGYIKISAEQTNGQIEITIQDDGKGIDVNNVVKKALENNVIKKEELEKMSDQEKLMLIFKPGLSTAKEITSISGRGVGMDVVKTNIEKLDGKINLSSEVGKGTKIVIELPLTLAILDGLEVEVGKENFIIPLSVIIESLQPKENMINNISKSENVLMLRDEFIPIIKLYELFDIEPQYTDFTKGLIVVIQIGMNKVGLFIDKFLHQHQIVVKPLDKNFKSVLGIGAATVNGNGLINLILDPSGLLELKKLKG